MKFKDFSKSLSGEIENLFATLGDSQLPEGAHRLDETVSMEEFMSRIKEMKPLEKQEKPKTGI